MTEPLLINGIKVDPRLLERRPLRRRSSNPGIPPAGSGGGVQHAVEGLADA